MAHFAELDENNVVLRVVVVANKNTADANGVEKEYIGQAYCERLFGGTWKQTSYNANFRKNYAGIGYTYHEDIDAFAPPSPFPSWTLNPDTATWTAPIPMPVSEDGTIYLWDEAAQSWTAYQPPQPTSPMPTDGKNYAWNVTTQSWEEVPPR